MALYGLNAFTPIRCFELVPRKVTMNGSVWLHQASASSALPLARQVGSVYARPESVDHDLFKTQYFSAHVKYIDLLMYILYPSETPTEVARFPRERDRFVWKDQYTYYLLILPAVAYIVILSFYAAAWQSTRVSSPPPRCPWPFQLPECSFTGTGYFHSGHRNSQPGRPCDTVLPRTWHRRGTDKEIRWKGCILNHNDTPVRSRHCRVCLHIFNDIQCSRGGLPTHS